MLGSEKRLDGDSVVGFSIAVDDDRQVIMICVDCEDTSLWSRVSTLSRRARHVGVGVKWGTLEDGTIGRWVFHWKNAGRVVRSDALDNEVNDVFEKRKEVDRKVDAVGWNGSQVGVLDVHVNKFVAIVWWKGKQMLIVQRLADHKVDFKGVIIDIIKIQLNNKRLGDNWETGSIAGEVQIRRWEVANVNAVVAQLWLPRAFPSHLGSEEVFENGEANDVLGSTQGNRPAFRVVQPKRIRVVDSRGRTRGVRIGGSG
jgi:hypothetical protein